MSNLPIIKPLKLIKILHKLGFEKSRQSGSHIFFKRELDGRTTVVLFHNKDIGRGLLKDILDDINMSPKEFVKNL